MARVTRIVIVGGGPGGYEAALVAAQHGAEVSLVDRDGLGGSTVLTDCVPSKTLIATAEVMTIAAESAELGVHHRRRHRARRRGRRRPAGSTPGSRRSPQRPVGRHRAPAGARGRAVCAAPAAWTARSASSPSSTTAAPRRSTPTSCWSPPARTPGCCPRPSPTASGSSTWQQVYDLPELPEHLVVVGSGVTGAEFASAYNALGCDVTLVSSRDRVLPGEDADAAEVLEDVFRAARHDGARRGRAPRRSSGSATASRSRSSDGATSRAATA